MQKARSHNNKLLLLQFVSVWFQVLFHSLLRVLFTFPSRYYSLSVSQEYLALPGGPGKFRQDFTSPALLRILLFMWKLHIHDFHALWLFFPKYSISFHIKYIQSYNPIFAKTKMVWANSSSIASTTEITFVFYSSSYLDVSVHWVCFFFRKWSFFKWPGCPIRRSWHQRFFAPKPSLSQLSRPSSPLRA